MFFSHLYYYCSNFLYLASNCVKFVDGNNLSFAFIIYMLLAYCSQRFECKVWTTYLRNLGSWSRSADHFFIILTFPQHIGEQLDWLDPSSTHGLRLNYYFKTIIYRKIWTKGLLFHNLLTLARQLLTLKAVRKENKIEFIIKLVDESKRQLVWPFCFILELTTRQWYNI